MKVIVIEGDAARADALLAALKPRWPDCVAERVSFEEWEGSLASEADLVAVDCAAGVGAVDAVREARRQGAAAVVAFGSPADLDCLADALAAGAHQQLVLPSDGFAHAAVVIQKAIEQGKQRRELQWLKRQAQSLQVQLADKDRLLRQMHREKADLAPSDSLTQLLNRRHFCQRLRSEFDRVRRYEAPVSCLMADIDHFRRVNSEHGFEAGDAVLVRIAEILAEHARSSDLVCRYGAEEFALLCPHTGKEGAVVAAERIWRAVAEEAFGEPDRPFRVTVSIGVASFPDEGIESPDQLLSAAEAALREAKNAGRNRVCVFGSDPRIED